MLRRTKLFFLATTALGSALGFSPAAAAAAEPLAIVIDPTTRGWNAPVGWLANVPDEATSATVTATLTNGSTLTAVTSAQNGWRFDFTGQIAIGTWQQVAAMTSNGAGASVPNDPLAPTAPSPPPPPAH